MQHKVYGRGIMGVTEQLFHVYWVLADEGAAEKSEHNKNKNTPSLMFFLS